MSERLPSHLQTIVDNVCAEGCKQVYDYIDKLENHLHPDGERLDPQEQSLLLRELNAIMAVYKARS